MKSQQPTQITFLSFFFFASIAIPTFVLFSEFLVSFFVVSPVTNRLRVFVIAFRTVFHYYFIPLPEARTKASKFMEKKKHAVQLQSPKTSAEAIEKKMRKRHNEEE